MRFNRREFMQMAAAGAAATAISPIPAMAKPDAKIRGILFDAFTIFNPFSLDPVAEECFPGKGKEIAQQWRVRQFEYSWLRTITKNYVSFWQVTEEALRWAAAFHKLDLTDGKRKKLMGAFLDLKLHPEVISVLTSFRKAGLKLAYMTNFTVDMLETMNRNAGLVELLGNDLTTEPLKLYKPDPRSYQMGLDHFGLAREEIAYAAFGGWDVAGAKWFGYPTFWVNHAHTPAEQLDVSADATGESLNDLAAWVMPKI